MSFAVGAILVFRQWKVVCRRFRNLKAVKNGTGNNIDWASHARREYIPAAEGLLTLSPDRFEIRLNRHFVREASEGSSCCRITAFH